MSDHVTAGDSEADRAALPASDDPREAVGAYDTADGVVFYDTENPLAWMQASRTVALEDMA
jgi:hypothetical protein